MSIKEIITVPDDTLKKISEPIEKIGLNEKKLIHDLLETMYHSKGIGLAAVQVGILKRILVIDVSSKNEKKKPMIFINPVIKNVSKETSVYEEGCLSIPKVRENVSRKPDITVSYYDENWELKEESYSGYAARIFQHEYDHIEGVLFTDYLSPLKRKLIQKKLNNITNGEIEIDYKMRFPKKVKK